jgi:hypothetical protein
LWEAWAELIALAAATTSMTMARGIQKMSMNNPTMAYTIRLVSAKIR